jgi:hypothetical protein
MACGGGVAAAAREHFYVSLRERAGARGAIFAVELPACPL